MEFYHKKIQEFIREKHEYYDQKIAELELAKREASGLDSIQNELKQYLLQKVSELVNSENEDKQTIPILGIEEARRLDVVYLRDEEIGGEYFRHEYGFPYNGEEIKDKEGKTCFAMNVGIFTFKMWYEGDPVL